MSSPENYRASHVGRARVDSYVNNYQNGFYAAQWSKIERPLLASVFSNIPNREQMDVLDFAAGTGRISVLASEHFKSVTAVDISEDMLGRIPHAQNISTICRDITADPLSATFDACTAFRFFLNAEVSLRIDALKAIRKSLRPGGLLIANLHMMDTSPAGLVYRAAKRLGFASHKTLGRDEFESLLKSQGFITEQIIPYSYTPRPGRLLPKLMQAIVEPGEKVAATARLPRRLAQCNLFIARKAGSA